MKVADAVNVIELEWIKDPWAMGGPSPITTPGTLTEDTGKAIREPWKDVHFIGTDSGLVWKG